jgi:hypothetical protein
MDFLTAASQLPTHVRDILVQWFHALTCEHFRRNINGDTTFPVGSPAAIDGLTAFAARLPTPLNGDAKEAGRAAMDSEALLVCHGPVADLRGPLCRLHNGKTLIEKHFNDSCPIRNPADLPKHISTDDDFQSFLNGSPLRGAVRSLFWAQESYVERCRSTDGDSVVRVRQLLGLSPFDPTPSVLIRLKNDEARRYVPTCFDAFDHQHYVPPAYEPGSPKPRHGWTRDLATEGPGAPEVVTQEQEPKFVEYVAVLS